MARMEYFGLGDTVPYYYKDEDSPATQYDVMQYTGLKDKNGKDIYEGDILSFDGNMTADNSFGLEPNGYIYDKDSKHEVVWNAEQACWDVRHDDDAEWKYRRDTHGLMLQAKSVKVIGNIYENPELLATS